MKKILLKKRKIGEHLTIGCELEGDEIGFFIASLDVSASCAFKISLIIYGIINIARKDTRI